MDMEVVGRHALFFDDDALAAFVNSGDALVEWHSLNIDRYDVRHLLSAPPPPRRRNRSYEPRTSDDPAVEFLIDQERYLDLPLESDQPELEEEGEKPSSSGGYRSVAFSYGDTGDSAGQENTDAGMEAKEYLPPFSIPKDIVQSLPPTEKVHQIIARTAIFVSKHGGQTEIILRVKQGDNPTFGFLMPDHHLHAYFRYLVEHPELLHTETDEKSQYERRMAGTHNDSGNVGGALSLLGSIYGSGEDEDEDCDDAVNASPSHDPKVIESVEIAAKDESVSRILSKRDRVSAVKKNSSIIGSKPKIVKGTNKEDNSGLISSKEEKLRNHGIGTTSRPILEPPPELKRLIDKLVEFVMRHGRQFEATLLEQDSKLERFPFLLSSNQYHPYYLKALEAGQQQLKVNGKIFNPGLEDLGGRGISKKASELKENDIDVPFESDRKEKFKMVIGKSKKEAQESEKESQESGFTVDAAAVSAILQAATKGIKSSGVRFITNTASNSHNNVVRNEDGQPEKAMAGTDSHGVALEADSSNGNLTEEQKLKAERLKRAKMFVAMLKSGALPSRTGTSRGPSAEPVESGGVLTIAGEASCASLEQEGSVAPAVVNESAPKVNFGEKQSERQSKRKYRSRSIGSEDDELDSYREGNSVRKHRSRSRRPEDDEDENAVKEHKSYREKRRHRSHSTEKNKNEGESSEENKERKHSENDESEVISKEEREDKRKHKSRSRRHKEDEEVGNALGKDRKHHRRRRSHSFSEESENGEESDGQDIEHKHYKSKHISHRPQHGDSEERDEECRRSYGSRSRKKESNSKTENAVENEDKNCRRKRSSHSYDENGESTRDEMDLHHSKPSHSKHKDDGRKDIYKEKKDSKRSRNSHHSSSESPDRHSSERRKKHRLSHTSSHHKDKHRNVRSSKDKESRRRHKHDSSSEDDNRHCASSGQAGKESHDVRDELEEGEISSKIIQEESQGKLVDVTSSEKRAPSLSSETTEVPADLRAKIRAMLMAARS